MYLACFGMYLSVMCPFRARTKERTEQIFSLLGSIVSQSLIYYICNQNNNYQNQQLFQPINKSDKQQNVSVHDRISSDRIGNLSYSCSYVHVTPVVVRVPNALEEAPNTIHEMSRNAFPAGTAISSLYCNWYY